ncbi:MAG: GTPase ObgE [Candidatus Peregrinibacteria bacterium]|nr:GTPase ObgE [Candidatus Peregrinibacteria bacterium]
MFCDELKIKVRAGNGGDGCISFRREKFVAKGGPNGGDGGNGGNIVIKTNLNLNTLSNLVNKKEYKAPKGENGMGSNMYGKRGENLEIEVPIGTIIFNSDKSKVLADLSKEGDEIIIAKGGKGGMGNARFVSSIRQTPRFAETGEPGEEKEIVMELKLVADIGIIGLPSAGKSTLISVISNARPKIAEYHFTTLIPNLGVVNMSKFGGDANDSFVVADIPGLIEGASQGKGLGHQFLKHIARTQILIHVIDGYLENADKNFKTINKELKDFDKTLAKKTQIVVINKIDLLDDEALKAKKKELRKAYKKGEIFEISSVTHEGLKPLLFEISKRLIEFRRNLRNNPPEESEGMTVLKPHLEKVPFILEKIKKTKSHKTFKISGTRINRLAIMTDIRNPEGLERMYIYMEKLGIKKLINKKGATFGDFIEINGKKIPYRK